MYRIAGNFVGEKPSQIGENVKIVYFMHQNYNFRRRNLRKFHPQKCPAIVCSSRLIVSIEAFSGFFLSCWSTSHPPRTICGVIALCYIQVIVELVV